MPPWCQSGLLPLSIPLDLMCKLLHPHFYFSAEPLHFHLLLFFLCLFNNDVLLVALVWFLTYQPSLVCLKSCIHELSPAVHTAMILYRSFVYLLNDPCLIYKEILLFGFSCVNPKLWASLMHCVFPVTLLVNLETMHAFNTSRSPNKILIFLQVSC